MRAALAAVAALGHIGILVSLIREIQAAALDSSVNLADLLRTCKVLAARLRHAEFAAWVSNELNGYPPGAELPEYRKVKTHSYGHFVGEFRRELRNAPIPPLAIPKKLRAVVNEQIFRDSVSVLAELHHPGTESINISWPPDIIAFCQHHAQIYEDSVLLQAWRVLPRATISGILGTVRNRILDFVLAIEVEAPDAGETAPGAAPPVAPERLTAIYNVTVQGGQAIVGTSGGTAQILSSQASFSRAIPDSRRAELESVLTSLRETITALAQPDQQDATDALVKVEAELAAPEPSAPRLERHIALLANISTIVHPFATQLQALLSQLLPG